MGGTQQLTSTVSALHQLIVLMRPSTRASSITWCLLLLLKAVSVQAIAISRSQSLRGGALQIPQAEEVTWKFHSANSAPSASGLLESALEAAPTPESKPEAEWNLSFQQIQRAVETVFSRSLGVRASFGVKHFVLTYWLLFAMSSLIWMMLVVMVAVLYRNGPGYTPELAPTLQTPADIQKTFSHWQSEWYHCGRNPSICCWAACCPFIRWAHTMDLMHFIDYGPACAMFLMLQCVNQTTGFLIIGCCCAVLLVHYRQKVRKVFGMEKYGTLAGYFEDFLCMCCCMPCTIAQEADHVQKAAEMGFPLPMCRTPRRWDPPPFAEQSA